MNKFIVIFILCSVSLQAQTTDDNSKHDSKTYYWFNLRIGKAGDNRSNNSRIYINNIENTIESGSFDAFVNAQESLLNSGRIALGPFSEEHQAKQSQYLYRNIGRYESPKKGKDDEDEPEYTFFYIKPIMEDSLQGIMFEPIPSRATTGTESEFMALLDEGLSFEKLAVGPFNDYDLAEKSKFVFRKNFYSGGENIVDPERKNRLLIMQKKWKSLKLQIVKQGEDKLSNKCLYRFNTNFPKNYFAPDAIQVITISAGYSDPIKASSSSITLQGDEVVDNNFTISSTSGTVYINILNFNNYKNVKIKGFLFESFIYNDTEMIELEPVFIAVN